MKWEMEDKVLLGAGILIVVLIVAVFTNVPGGLLNQQAVGANSGYVVKDNHIFSSNEYTAGDTIVLGGTVINTLYPQTVPVPRYPFEGTWEAGNGNTIAFVNASYCVIDSEFYTSVSPVLYRSPMVVGGGPDSRFMLMIPLSKTWIIELSGIVLEDGSFNLTGPTKYQPTCYGCPIMKTTVNFVRTDKVNVWGREVDQNTLDSYWYKLWYKPVGDDSWVCILNQDREDGIKFIGGYADTYMLKEVVVRTNKTWKAGSLRAEVFAHLYPDAPIMLYIEEILGNDTAVLKSSTENNLPPYMSPYMSQNRTPGFELVSVVVALGVAFVLLRKRRGL